MDLPPSAAPRRRAPPQGRLCGRSPASSERRRVASLVAVPAGAPVSVARPRPRPKGTTAPGKPAPCVSRASLDPGRRPSPRRTVRPRRGPGAGGTRRQPSLARPAVAGYGISPRSRCGLPEPRHCIGKRGRPVLDADFCHCLCLSDTLLQTRRQCIAKLLLFEERLQDPKSVFQSLAVVRALHQAVKNREISSDTRLRR